MIKFIPLLVTHHLTLGCVLSKVLTDVAVETGWGAGIYRFDGATVRCISEDINPTIWDDVTTNRMQNAVGITYRGLYIVSIETSADTPSSKNNRLFIYEWKTNSWSINKNVGATHFTAFGG